MLENIKGPITFDLLGTVPTDGFPLTGKIVDAQMTNKQNDPVTLRELTNKSANSGTVVVEWISGNEETLTIPALSSKQGLWNKVKSSSITPADLWGYV